ncbi:hypothetical protein [Bradyrhizobium monzae]|uniref:hypothetical protein n=1 Tax=Bradyrhizobium sp. Oc8 TaxID=2876780 RepID=UPI001F1EBA90|nr:hypothetical protein [Bradyrhizobium sp. Oc8]
MFINRRGRSDQACCCFWLALAVGTTAPPAAQHAAFAQIGPASLEQAQANYQRELAEYDAARQQYETLAAPYWKSVSDKRQLRNAKRRNGEPVVVDDYVLAQPPVYAGPPRPVDPAAPAAQAPVTRAAIPTVGDFLSNALTQFQFVPERPTSELEFKASYAGVAAEAGLTRSQIVRVYAFESGGNGRYDVQAGLEYDRPDGRPISTALGYNQLLNTNSVELLAEKGDQFLTALRRKSVSLRGEDRKALDSKIEALRRMIEFARSVPDEWGQHETLANTPQGLGIHAMNLDVDVGPLLQTQKLLDSLIFARTKGLLHELSASELEMMNLTGDGNGYDLVSMPPDTREQVPTSNFFQRGGYERNPVAIRHNTAASLFAAIDAKMDVESMLPGATELAAAYDAAIRRCAR